MIDILRRRAGTLLMLAALTACSKEARTLASDQPQTPPVGADDSRVSRYQDNAYQVSQGGRYFTWYGCGGAMDRT